MAPFWNIAHRGDSANAPENTFAAFERALAVGVADIETDVRRTRDGALVLLHEATVDRTTDGVGKVAELTLAQVRALDAGAWFGAAFAGQRVPLLDELLERYLPRARLHLEVKDTSPAAVEALLERLAAVDPSCICLTSFDRATLLAIKARAPRWPVAWLFRPSTAGGTWEQHVAQARADGIDLLCPPATEVTRERVMACHAAGLRIRCWGVGRDEGRMRAVLEAGADGTTVDAPAVMARLLREATGR